jgi:hypothetical protein
MTILVFVALGAAVLFGLWLWIHCLHDCCTSSSLSVGSKRAWFVVILLNPLAGPIIYLSSKKNIEKYSSPDPKRLERLLSRERGM